MKEVKLNVTLYFTVPVGKDPGQFVEELQNMSQREMLSEVTDFGSCWDWEVADTENYDWVAV